jgi:predicted nucleic acid-binding protein
MYLLDTMVLSETVKRRPDPRVIGWYRNVRSADAFISVLSIGEIERGIAGAQQRSDRFARGLAAWLDQILVGYADRILLADVAVVRRWGRLCNALRHAGTDLLIAATALEHGLIVATRNRRHFDPTGVRVLNPYDLN